jgi:hypothetical protein
MPGLDQKDPVITALELDGGVIDIGKEASLAMPASRRYRYKQRVIYTLDDGRKIGSEMTGDTKPKLAKAIENKRRYIAEGNLQAIIRDGAFIGYRTVINLR